MGVFKMKIDIQHDKQKLLINFIDCDRIDTTNLKEIKEQLNPILLDEQNSNFQELVFDFENIDFMDSSGLAMIINVYKNSISQEQNLTIINPSEFVKELFDVTKISSFVNIGAN